VREPAAHLDRERAVDGQAADIAPAVAHALVCIQYVSKVTITSLDPSASKSPHPKHKAYYNPPVTQPLPVCGTATLTVRANLKKDGDRSNTNSKQDNRE
jgi:hypothetical protein